MTQRQVWAHGFSRPPRHHAQVLGEQLREFQLDVEAKLATGRGDARGGNGVTLAAIRSALDPLVVRPASVATSIAAR